MAFLPLRGSAASNRTASSRPGYLGGCFTLRWGALDVRVYGPAAVVFALIIAIALAVRLVQ